MKKFLVFLTVLSMVLAISKDSSARGGSFSSGRSSFSSGSFSSGRSSFGSSSHSSGTSSTTTSKPSTSTRGSTFGSSSRGLFGTSKSTKTGGSFGTSSRGSFGTSPSTRSGYGSTAAPMTAKEQLYASSSTYTPVSTPGGSMSVYHYYYPSPFYGSGYSFYQYYFWYHMFGNHSQCYHNGGGLAKHRACSKDTECYQGEKCDLKVKECVLKE